MNTKIICDVLSFMAMVKDDGFKNGSLQETLDYFNTHFTSLPQEVKEHVKTLLYLHNKH